jgi:hypothetical protein
VEQAEIALDLVILPAALRTNLLHLTSFAIRKGELAFTRAWKGHDWEAVNRLHEKGLASEQLRALSMPPSSVHSIISQ